MYFRCLYTPHRSLVLAYLHDCSHCVFSSSLPSLQAADVDLVLPCDELLWEAPSAVEWYARLNEPGVYGHVYTRLPGVPLQNALRALGAAQVGVGGQHHPSIPTTTPTERMGTADVPPELKHLNRFALFVLVHGILRNLYMPTSLQVPSTACDAVRRNASHVGFGFLLHNWMRAWDASPASSTSEQIPFAYDALPFYWLAQVSLFAARLPPEETMGSLDPADTFNVSGTNGFLGGVRFYIMKEWLGRIRWLLRAGTPFGTADLWKALLAVREGVARGGIGAGGCGTGTEMGAAVQEVVPVSDLLAVEGSLPLSFFEQNTLLF